MLKFVGYDIVFREVPDEVTLAVNLSLCDNHCPGCHSPYLQTDAGEELTDEVLTALVRPYLGEVTCLGLMGGDNDPERVAQICRYAKKTWGGQLRTAWYSGRSSAPQGIDLSALDYLKLGPYVARLGSLDKPTTNQRLYRLHAGAEPEDITARFWQPAGRPM